MYALWWIDCASTPTRKDLVDAVGDEAVHPPGAIGAGAVEDAGAPERQLRHEGPPSGRGRLGGDDVADVEGEVRQRQRARVQHRAVELPEAEALAARAASMRLRSANMDVSPSHCARLCPGMSQPWLQALTKACCSSGCRARFSLCVYRCWWWPGTSSW
jgi:hypothetical protein